ncbi:MAG: cysteine desulfurase [Burkholderiales bacterium]|nr:cysteine desulfurase [Anaerolineae bacterium]
MEVLPFDVEAVRQDFPILRQEHHAGTPLIYLDNGASSQKPAQVIDTISDYYQRYHANVHRGIHKLSEAATAAYEDARRKVQQHINASSRREVIFTRGTTESINLVAQTWGRANLKPGDVVISTVMEHHANIVSWQMLASERGFTLRYLPILVDGTLDLAQYERLLQSEPVKLVVVTHCSNVLGTINPIANMARMAHAAGALLLADGAQSVPHMPVDVQALDVDFMAFSSHKMLGPTGIGVLYGKRDLLEAMPPWMGGGDMISRVTLQGSTWNNLPYKFEAGTPSIAEGIGLGAAVDYLNAVGMEQIQLYTDQLTTYALDHLHEIPQVKIFGAAPARGSLVSFAIEGIHAHDAAQLLDSDGIAVRAGHHCAMPLHEELNVAASVRASFYLYNTFAEIDALAASVRRAIGVYSA